MSLQNKWQQFVSSQNGKKISEIKHKSEEFLVKYRKPIKICVDLAETARDFAIYKSPFSIVKGVFNTVSEIAEENYYAFDLFNLTNGWEALFSQRATSLSRLLASSLNNHPYKQITFKHDSAECRLYTFDFGQLVFIDKKEVWNSFTKILYRGTPENKETALKFLAAEKLKQLPGSYIKLTDTKEETALVAEECVPLKSKRSDELTVYLKKAFELGINRSFLLNGPPGSGKTTLATTLVSNLGLKALVYKDDSYEAIDVFKFVVKYFGVDAVILDDFDQIAEPTKLLSTLDSLNRQVKLLIGLVNSMKDFHPAVLRPQRFSERRLVDTMDEDVVKTTLGDLTEEYFEKVKSWPISYITELACRAKLYPKEKMNEQFEELKERVAAQLKSLSEEPEKDNDKSKTLKKIKKLSGINK